MIRREKAIKILREEHEEMRGAIEDLSEEELTRLPVFKESGWTVKDIIAHISAWHLQLVEDVDLVLNNKKPWYIGKTEDDFSAQEVRRRKDWPLKKILQKWNDSLSSVIQRIERLTDKEWKHDAGYKWEDGTPLTVYSLFEYEYEGANHEGGHAKQILRWRKR